MKLPRVSGVDVVKVFARIGFSIDRQSGSHIVMKQVGFPTLSVPNHAELAPGTLRALIRRAQMTVEEFTRWLQ